MPSTSHDGAGARAVAMAAVVLAAAVVFRGSLAYFFSQDDFAGLARARGVLPALEGPWRWISGQLYFDAMGALAGLEPFPYRLASLVAHAATSAVLFAILARRTRPAAALVGATFFAAHPALYTALYSISGIGEILAALAGLGAVAALGATGSRRWAAAPLFALSLMCKESTLLLPLAAWLAPPPARAPAGAGARARLLDPVVGTLAAIAIAYVATFLLRDVFSLRAGLDERAPYALRFDGTLAANLLTYLGWTANFLLPTVRSFADAVDPGVRGYAVAAAIVALAGLAVPALRERGWVFGVALYVAWLAPVLPLANHTYHYYLYAPLAGAALCVAAFADTALGRLPPRAAAGPARGGSRRRGPAAAPSAPAAASGPLAWGAAAVVAALLVVNGALLVRKIETFPFVHPDLRADATVDRARIAGNAIGDLRAAGLPDGVVLRLWSPTSVAAGQTPGVETYYERNVRDALLDGVAVRVMVPAVRRVEFVRSFTPDADSVRYGVYRLDGHLRVARPAELDSVLNALPARP